MQLEKFKERFYKIYSEDYEILSIEEKIVYLKHKCGYEFSRSINRLLNDPGNLNICKQCRGNLTNQNFIDRCYKNNAIPLQEYTGNREDEILFRCTKCGEEFKTRQKYMLEKGHSCKSYLKFIKDINDYIFEEVYYNTNSDSKIRVIHKTCKYEFCKNAQQIQSGNYKCPICTPKSRISEKIFREKLNLLSDKYELLEFSSYQEKCKVKHLKCGNEFIVNPRDLLRNRGCPCRRLKDLNQYQIPEGFTIDNYKDSSSEITVTHKCGYSRTLNKLGYFLNNPYCPSCSPEYRNDFVSEPEQVLTEYIQSLEFKCQKLYRDSNFFYELDIYIPELKIGFEYNGLYWHSSAKKHVNKTYHKNKTDFFLSKGIKVYHLWEHWGLEKCKSIIQAKLGKCRKVYARNTKIKSIPAVSAREFLNKYHIDGYTIAAYSFGLFLNGDLISVLTIRRNKSYGLEIARYATKSGLHIVGGFSKLLNYFIKEYNPTQIVTYLYRDLCPIANESVYAKTGFIFQGDSGPILSYFNLKKHVVESRQKYQKHKLEDIFPDSFSEDKTEKQILEENNIYQLYDSGNYKFIWTSDQE